MNEFVANLEANHEQIFSTVEENALKSIYNQKDLNDFKILYTPPLTTTLRVNTCFYKLEHAVDIIEEINKNEWDGRFHISTNSNLFKDIIFIRGFFNNVPKRLDESILIDKGCVNSVLRGSNAFLPGIMGVSKNIRKNTEVSVYAHISNNCTNGARKFDPTKELFLGNGILTIDSREIFVRINKLEKGVAVRMTDSLVCQPNFDTIFDKYPSMIFAQNLPSAIVGYVMDPKPDEYILDMCASPGGKTTHLAQLMNNQGRIVAIDKTLSKMKKIINTVSGQNLTNVTAYVYDSCQLYSDNEKLTESPPFNAETFDKVLLDAPCSGLGQRPYLTSRYCSMKQLSSFVPQQRKLFETAVRLTKVNGFIVYSTCTLTLDENENLVAWALHKFKDIIQLVPHTPYISDVKVQSNLTLEQSKLVQRFDPILQCIDKNNDCFTSSELIEKDTIGKADLDVRIVDDALKRNDMAVYVFALNAHLNKQEENCISKALYF